MAVTIVQVSADPRLLNDVIGLGQKKTTILPRIQEVCNGLPYHDMYGIGWANWVDRNTNKSYITLGQNIQNR